MHSEIALISTITVGLVYALIGGYIASRLGLPPLVGYLLAGVAEGPNEGRSAPLGIWADLQTMKLIDYLHFNPCHAFAFA